MPREPAARMIATTAASQGAWNAGSSASRSTRPNPCMPPTSWIPSMARILAGRVAAGSGARRAVADEAGAERPGVDTREGASHRGGHDGRVGHADQVLGDEPDVLGR